MRFGLSHRFKLSGAECIVGRDVEDLRRDVEELRKYVDREIKLLSIKLDALGAR
ncbi:MAG: hypothetical protein ACP5GZ_10880 [Vulcanisaeta sp.]|uniref:hypothetical protein n=1 Tax=Vulcanisaeta sp. TaxID=2020871 RepID=UPI003D1389DC